LLLTPVDYLMERLQDPAMSEKERTSLARTLLPYVAFEMQRYGRLLTPSERQGRAARPTDGAAHALLVQAYAEACLAEVARRRRLREQAATPQLPTPAPAPAGVPGELRPLLAKIERQVGDVAVELGRGVSTVKKLERAFGDQGERRASDSELLELLVRKVTGLERRLEVIEPTKAPRPSRRRPLGE
jgi:hypothetical protein